MRAHPDAAAVSRRIQDGYDVVRHGRVAAAAGSQSLAEELGGEWVPNAVDVTRFDAPAAPPQWLDGVPHPRAVYVGTVEERSEKKLLADLASSGAANVVVVGP